MPAIRQMRVSPDGAVWWPQVAAGGKSAPSAAADGPRPEDPSQTNAALDPPDR